MCEQDEQNGKLNNDSGDEYSELLGRTNLIINYIPQSSTVHDLTLLFKLAGEVESIKVMRHPRTGYSYGYGFVKYDTAESACKAIELFNKLPYRNKVLKVSYSRPSSQVTKNANLYISNLPKEFTEDQLHDIFGVHGEIIQKRILRDKFTGAPKGVAFVRFAKGVDAQKAIEALNGSRLVEGTYPLRVRIADDYSQQRANFFYEMALAEQRAAFPFNINRSFAQMSIQNHQYSAPQRALGGGDVDLLPSHW